VSSGFLSTVYQITHRHVTAVKHNFWFSYSNKQHLSMFDFDQIEHREGRGAELLTDKPIKTGFQMPNNSENL